MKVRRRDEGIALMLVLLFVALLSAIVVEFCYEMQVEASFVGRQSDELQAYVAAKSAVAEAMAVLSSNQQIAAQAGGLGAALAGQSSSSSAGSMTSGSADTLLDPWAQGVPYQPINNAVMEATITDEYGKLNLNALINRATDKPNPKIEKILRALFQLRQVQQDPTDAIIDWLDVNDDTQGADGAESDYYQSLSVPYWCRNGPMHSIEELLLIRGITPQVYFGNPDQGQVPLSELLTVHGDPKGRVNINTAKGELLEAIGEALGGNSGLGNLVLQRQQQNPFLDTGSITSSLSGYGDAAKEFITTSKVFRVYGDGQAGDPDPVRVRIEAFLGRLPGAGASGFTLLDWRVIR